MSTTTVSLTSEPKGRWQCFVAGLNEIHNNWFGLAILCLGVFMAMRGHTDFANSLIVGGFAIINGTSIKVQN